MLEFVIDQTTRSARSSSSLVISHNEATKSETENAQKELGESIDKMIQAITSNRSVQTTASNLAQKGFFAALWGNVSGANDKDLATMVKDLGGSLETTQAVVQVMLRLQTRKDYVLRGFHATLVEKVINIQADTKTLDKNQRTAVVDILSALRDQIGDQLRHSEMVDQHEQQLQQIDDKCSSLKKSDEQLSLGVDALQVNIKELTAKSAAELMEASTQTHLLQSSLRELDMKLTEHINVVMVAQANLRSDLGSLLHEFTSATSALSDQLELKAEHMAILETRLARIDTEIARSLAWPARLRRHSFGIAGILVGVAGLVASLPK